MWPPYHRRVPKTGHQHCNVSINSGGHWHWHWHGSFENAPAWAGRAVALATPHAREMRLPRARMSTHSIAGKNNVSYCRCSVTLGCDIVVYTHTHTHTRQSALQEPEERHLSKEDTGELSTFVRYTPKLDRVSRTVWRAVVFSLVVCFQINEACCCCCCCCCTRQHKENAGALVDLDRSV